VEIQKLRSGAASSEYAAPPGLKFCCDCGSTNMPRLRALKWPSAKTLPRRAKKTAAAKINFGMDVRGGVAFEFPPP
jgi:hypothetical protein